MDSGRLLQVVASVVVTENVISFGTHAVHGLIDVLYL